MNNIAVLLLNVREAFCCPCCSPYQCEIIHWGTTTLTVPLDIFPVPFPFSEHYWVYVQPCTFMGSPLLPSKHRGGGHLRQMRQGAIFVNFIYCVGFIVY